MYPPFVVTVFVHINNLYIVHSLTHLLEMAELFDQMEQYMVYQQ